MRGAFIVGALKTIHNKLGTDYFDTIFSTSVGVFEQAFFAAGQPDTMENTWREYVTGRQLINFNNIWKRKPVLDLDYLVDLFQTDKSLLDVENLKSSKLQLFTFVADYETRESVLLDLKGNPIFDTMRATSALPIFYPRKVIINGRRYVDSTRVTKNKLQKSIEETLKGYDEVLAISAYFRDPDLKGIRNIIKPSKMPLWGALDTNRKRIIQTIEQGEKDAERFIIENNLLP